MDSEREDARRKTRKQADKMLELSRYTVAILNPYDPIIDFLRKRFGEAKVGDTVLLAIPDVDRGRCEFANITALVLEVLDGGLYKLGCRSGVLDSLYSRNQFAPTLETFIRPEDVPMDKTLSLQTAAGAESMGGGQGFFKCSCTGNCTTKRCKCVKDGRKYNSKNKRSCVNIDQ